MQKIRIGLRGAAGLLGSRFAAAVAKSSDLELAVGIFKNDATLRRTIERLGFGGPLARSLPGKMYLDESDEVIAQVNAKMNGALEFRSVSELNLKEECDVIVDAAAPGMGHVLQKQYQSFPGSVILQDGEYPRGRLIAPPLLAQSQGGNRYRQGGCFLSGVAPVFFAIQEFIRSARIHLVMQYDGRDTDFLITERVNTFRVADAYIPRMEDELSALFPKLEMKVEGVIQIPGMLHYAVTLEMELHEKVSEEKIRERISASPRVRILPDSVTGTYEVNLSRAMDDRMQPILVFGGSMGVVSCGSTRMLRMKLALYYRTLAVLPNIDAVRILAHHINPMEAMRQTDLDMGFI